MMIRVKRQLLFFYYLDESVLESIVPSRHTDSPRCSAVINPEIDMIKRAGMTHVKIKDIPKMTTLIGRVINPDVPLKPNPSARALA